MLDQVANQGLLCFFISLRRAGQVAGWAHSRLRHLYAASIFPLQVTMASGKVVSVDVVGF